MKALSDELEAVDLSLIIELFKRNDVLAKGKVSLLEVGERDRTLVDYPDAKDEFAEVLVIFVREDAVKDARPETIHVQKQLPGFVATRKLFGGISRGAAK